jgi:two-component system invasion response regulator UvrY
MSSNPTADEVTVLVVDDAPAFRVAAAAVLHRTPGFALVGEAGTGEDAVNLAAVLRPRLVLMDMRLPGISGVQATRRIVDADPKTVVILCSTYQRSDLPDDVGGSGASAYMHKEELAPANIRRLWDEAAGGVTPSAAPAPA